MLDCSATPMKARSDIQDAGAGGRRRRHARAHRPGGAGRFLAEPYDDVTIASVARDAGVSHQTLLNHFESKEGLFAAAAERFAADLVASARGPGGTTPSRSWRS